MDGSGLGPLMAAPFGAPLPCDIWRIPLTTLDICRIFAVEGLVKAKTPGDEMLQGKTDKHQPSN
jgi:hypothetical protein